MSTAPTPNRGEIWLVDFDPSVGAEIRKVRPAVVVNVVGIGRLPLHIVVPLTDWKPHFAKASWLVPIPAAPTNGLSKDSAADAFQVKSISVARFLRCLGAVTSGQLDDIASAIALCVGAP
jgi:mRNA interferase MazF